MTASDRMAGRHGDWFQTYTGVPFFPLDPRAEDVNIHDIAHALANNCRYNGHCRVFYSVAQHSVLVSRHVPAEHALWGLLHDAAEAYLSDIPRPWKNCFPAFRDIEETLDRLIATRFNLPWPMPAEVRRVDTAILADEKAALMGPAPARWTLPEPALGIAIEPWDRAHAHSQFVQRWLELSSGRYLGG